MSEKLLPSLGPPDQAERDLIATELGRNLLVEAAAGTGKTTGMVARMVALLTLPDADIERLAAVTFTRKAAAELRARFRTALEREAASAGREETERERLADALRYIDKCFIGTIHAFCARLLRERPVEAGIDLAFTELDEAEDERLRAEAWDLFTDRLIARDPERLLAGFSRLGIGLMDLRDAFINKFALYPDVDLWPAPGPDAELPGLVPRIGKIQTYARDMEDLAAKLPGDCGNDKLVPRYRIIPRVVSHCRDLRDVPELMEVLQRFDTKNPTPVQKFWVQTGNFTADDAKREQQRFLDFNRAEVTPLLDHIYGQRYRLVLRAMARAREVYDELRAGRGHLNYQDLLMKAAALLRGLPHVRKYFQDRFARLLVDEFQDTDPVQAEVMLLLTASDLSEKDWRKCVPRPGSLFVVGDPKQSIYRFRRADIVTYNQVKDIIARGDGKAPGLVVRLSANFRATAEIIAWVSRVFEPGPDGRDKGGAMLRFPGTETPQSPGYVGLTPGRDDWTGGELKGIYVLLIPEELPAGCNAREYEADFIARAIRRAVDTGQTVPRSGRELEAGKTPAAAYSDFLIITRNTTNLSAYAAALQRYGIPHQVTGGTALNEVPELQLLFVCLTAVIRPDDPVALVGALRSELFGVSDAALYRLKRAGGKFAWNARVPDGLAPADADAFSDAFSRLGRYSLWLASLPPLAAIEQIIADLGLLPLAASRPGGDSRAGGLAKAVEVLRRRQAEMWTAAQLVEFLGLLARSEEKYDGTGVNPPGRDLVRVMNLHKVKGLEAPVVFLADPSGGKEHGVDIAIDRSGGDGKVRGYMLAEIEAGWQPRLIARPPDWDQWRDAEREFLRAEDLRLRYVAATRAGAALIVTRMAKVRGPNNNPWRYFEPFIPEDSRLPDPGEQQAPARAPAAGTARDAADADRAARARLEASLQATYAETAAKQYALSHTEFPEDHPEPVRVDSGPLPDDPDPGGAEWGSVIHLLLQAAMKNPGADLLGLAASALAEHDLDPALAPAARETVIAVTASDLWARALRSERALTEVPFETVIEDQGSPVLARGVIDLVFRESAGWVLVDYKTDAFVGAAPAALVRRYAPQLRLYAEVWERAAGPVMQKAIFFTRSGELVPVD